MKTCSKCKAEKTEGEFYALPRFICKKCLCAGRREWKFRNRLAYQKQQRGYQQKYRLKDPEGVRERQRKWVLAHPEAMKIARKRYNEKYPGREAARTLAWKQAHPEYEKLRYRTDPQYRLKILLRGRLGMALKVGGAKKAASTLALLGCPLWLLRAHFEFLFRPGMMWKNHGTIWEIDHIKPCSSFNLIDPEQQKACFHWTNLQPLFVMDNRQKSNLTTSPTVVS